MRARWKLAPSMLAWDRSTPRRSAVWQYALRKSAFRKSAFRKSPPLRFAYDKSTFSVCRAAWLNSSTIPSRSNKTSGPSLNFVMKALLASSSKGFRLFLFCRGRRALPCDDLIGNLVVSCLRNNVLPDKIILPAVGPVVDDLLGVGIADAGKRHQFLLARRVDVD